MKQKLLEHYILEAMAKAPSQPRRKVTAVLAEAMPEVCIELRRMLTATDNDLSTKRFAITMLENLWRTLLTTSQSETRTAVKRLATTVRAKKVAVEQTKTALKVHQVRAETDKKLATIGGV
jgi:hypothetical protein